MEEVKAKTIKDGVLLCTNANWKGKIVNTISMSDLEDAPKEDERCYATEKVYIGRQAYYQLDGYPKEQYYHCKQFKKVEIF